MALFDRVFKKKEKPTKEPPKEPIEEPPKEPTKKPPKELDKYGKPILREASSPELEELMQKQTNFYDKLGNKEYYGSEQSKKDAEELKKEIAKYLEDNPKDYIVRGAKLTGTFMDYTKRVPDDELEIIELLGKGSYYEDMKDYPKAIEVYKEAYKLTGIVFKEEIDELIREYGERDYLYQGKARNRIRVCENIIKRNEIKELEAEAKALEETNPTEAINKYNELNKINPNLKKYNKRIARIIEKEAKALEKTDPKGAIELYNKLNVINPDVKKYNKRIEILEKRL